MITGIVQTHIATAEQHLLEVERAFPNLSIEAKERLALADTHLRVALAYQLQSLEDALAPIVEGLLNPRVMDFGGVDLGSVDPSSFFSNFSASKRRPWWRFWRW